MMIISHSGFINPYSPNLISGFNFIILLGLVQPII